MKPLVFTALKIKSEWVNKQNKEDRSKTKYQHVKKAEEFVDELFVSLRTIGKYNGDIVLLFYGGRLSDNLRKIINNYNIKVVYISENPEDNLIVVRRFLDLEQHVDLSLYTHIVHLDHDMWLQDSIDRLFKSIPESGCLFGGHMGGQELNKYNKDGKIRRIDLNFLQNQDEEHFIYECEELSKNNKNYVEFKERMLKMKENNSGWYGVSGGLMAGKKEYFLEKIHKIRKSYETGFIARVWGSDEFLLSYLYDLKNDVHDNRFNYSISDYNYKTVNGPETPRTFYTKNGEKIIVFHRNGEKKKDYKTSFKFNYPSIYNS